MDAKKYRNHAHRARSVTYAIWGNYKKKTTELKK